MRNHPDGAWTTEDLCELVYPDVAAVEKKHRVSVLRVLRRIYASDPDWTLYRSDSHGGTLVLLNLADLQSYALGRLKSDWLSFYRKGQDWSRKDETGLLRELAENEKYLALTKEGGHWWRHVQLHIADRDNDTSEGAETLRDAHQRSEAEIRRALGR